MIQATDKTRRWLLIGIIPAIMLTVFARQIYLQRSAQLSTWKGGGMGMFASADGTVNRYANWATPGSFAWMSMVAWDLGDGNVIYGEDQEVWAPDRLGPALAGLNSR